jgi:hypothetical protein
MVNLGIRKVRTTTAVSFTNTFEEIETNVIGRKLLPALALFQSSSPEHSETRWVHTKMGRVKVEG